MLTFKRRKQEENYKFENNEPGSFPSGLELFQTI
jgi:hypothetical protein